MTERPDQAPSIHRQVIGEYMRKQFIRFNIPTNNVKLLVEKNHAFNNNINTIFEALEEACAEVEMEIKFEFNPNHLQ